MENCKDCKFFMAQNESQGLCRRNPPTVIPTMDFNVVSVFPSMQNEGWCGEFKEPKQ